LNKIRFIFLDIDGTLLTSDHRISRGTITAIQRVNNFHNIQVVLTTARPPQAIRNIYKRLELKTPAVCFNGALIIEKAGEIQTSILHSQCIDASQLYPIYAAASNPHLNISFYKNEDWISDKMDAWVRQEEEITETEALIQNAGVTIQKWTESQTGPHKILLMGEPHEIDITEKNLNQLIGNSLNISKSKPTYLEIMNSSASKTSAINFLLGKYAMTPQEILAIGDNFNDIEMLRLAGIGIAMGNAPEEVKKHADFVTLDNNSEGIQWALDTFIP
jgi:Cof subfamily protein (haloacid dehalogenase superfamily)